MKDKIQPHKSQQQETDIALETEILLQSYTVEPHNEQTIPFRSEKASKFKRPIINVPIELLKFRGDNDRISEWVDEYNDDPDNAENLDEKSETGQKILEDFYWKTKNEKMIQTSSHLRAEGQIDPAIATADGFMVNGNRRLCCLRKLNQPDLSHMKVILLPGSPESMQNALKQNPKCKEYRLDNGPPPTIDEILDVEFFCQYASEPEVEYGLLAEANGYIRRLKRNKSILDIIKMYPQNRFLSEKQLEEKVDEVIMKLIGPRKLADEYIEFHKFPSIKFALSSDTGPGFDAFITAYGTAFHQFPEDSDSEKKRDKKIKALSKKGILINEIAKYKAFYFTVMRHGITFGTDMRNEMRKYNKLWNAHKDGIKKMLNEIEPSGYESVSKNDEWKRTYTELIHKTMNDANNMVITDSERSKPSERVAKALAFLDPDKLNLSNLPIGEHESIMDAANRIKESANDLWKECNTLRKKKLKLHNKPSNKK